MKLFGREITVSIKKQGPLASVESRGGWYPVIREGDTGNWQRNVSIVMDNVLTHPTVFACVTMIPADLSKMCLDLVEKTEGGIWEERENPAYSPVLRKPNRYQTIGQFIEQWMYSKLIWGNTYVLKERDQRGVVVGLYILDPNRVRVLVAEDGSVYYDMMRDTLSSLPREHVVAPAREIIHDRMYPLYHPLVGLSPLHASGLLATLGLNIISSSSNLFANGSSPNAILTAPAGITEEQATALQESWMAQFSGDNYGKVAVLGGDLKYEALNITADKSQVAEQWGKTSEAIATTFKVPFHFVGGPMPPYNNVQTLTVQYFSQCLQALAKKFEDLLDEGLGLGRNFGNRLGTRLDTDDLLIMDSMTRADTATKAVGSGMSYNEARFRYYDLGPVKGGESPLAQQQMYSLSALARRDEAQPAPPTDPIALPTPPADPPADKAAHVPHADVRRILRQKWAA